MSFYPLERLMNLYDGYCRAYSVSGLALLLVQENGKRYLLKNQCPHQQALLSNASLSVVDESVFLRCPAHGMTFDLTTGRTKDGCDQVLQFVPIAYDGPSLGFYT